MIPLCGVLSLNRASKTERLRVRGNVAALPGALAVLACAHLNLAPRFYPVFNRRFPGTGPDLQPVATPQTRVEGILTLHHHTFEIQRFDFLKERLATTDYMISKPNASSVVFRQDAAQ